MLDNDDLDADMIERLCNPPEGPPDVNDPDLTLAIKIFLVTTKASQSVYTDISKAISEHFPNCDLLSIDRLKWKISNLTGIMPLFYDMCNNLCIGYTGPFTELIHCSYCGILWYEPIQYDASDGEIWIPCKKFLTIPLGPLLQAMWGSTEIVQAMQYHDICTCQILAELAENGGWIKLYEDFLSGSEYLAAFANGRISIHDTIHLLSINGAQFFDSKTSSCWIDAWGIYDLAPNIRYKVKAIQPGGFIPGPNQPKNYYSLSYPNLHHLSALWHESFHIWDAYDQTVHLSWPFFTISAADGPGLVHLNGQVSHQGYYSCRTYCPNPGRHAPGENTYYLTHLKPHNYILPGSDHNDYPFHRMPVWPLNEYLWNVNYVITSPNAAQYTDHHKETSIVKLSILSGLPSTCMIPLPLCCSHDLMYLIVFNITDLHLSLWHGKMTCKAPDDKQMWDWAVLEGDTWLQHGAVVAQETPYLPESFKRPPQPHWENLKQL